MAVAMALALALAVSVAGCVYFCGGVFVSEMGVVWVRESGVGDDGSQVLWVWA